jgi:hypothetical protein
MDREAARNLCRQAAEGRETVCRKCKGDEVKEEAEWCQCTMF